MAIAAARELQPRVAALEVLSSLSPALQAGDMAAFRAQAEAVVARQLPGANIPLLHPDGSR